MTTPHTITITITPDGQVEATVNGVNGPECGPISAALDELGHVTVDRETEDFYLADEQSVQNDDLQNSGVVQ